MEIRDMLILITLILFLLGWPILLTAIDQHRPPVPHIEYVTEDGKTETIYIPEGLALRGEWELQNNRDGWRLIFGLEEK